MCLQVLLSALLVIVFGVDFAVSSLQTNATSELYRSRRQASCNPSEYRCQNGQCISSYDKCDGIKTCNDGTDETSAVCKNPGIKCPLMAFECDYGACIDERLRCDGKDDCVDGSDEKCSPPQGAASHTLSCSENEFQCANRQCISGYDKCDGKQDCDDMSDESYNECNNFECPPRSFKCNYGACVDTTLKCDGKQDCVDGSDEKDCTTNPSNTIASIPWQPPVAPLSSTPGSSSCKLPEQPEDGAYISKVTECTNNPRTAACRSTPGAIVPSDWAIKYTCNFGYTHSQDSQYSICENGHWQNPIVCIKLCPPLESSTVNVKCYYGGAEINCNVSMKPGTEATAECKPHYKKHSWPEYSTLLCLKSGKWSYQLFYCVADCGLSSKPEPLISNGKNSTVKEVPWLAAIYRKVGQTWDQQCGGTLITTHIVVTAAHCLVKSDRENVPVYRSDIKVGLGKYYRSYYENEALSIIAEVKDVVIHPEYTGNGALFALDIGLVNLMVNLQVSANIMPACVDWSGYFKPAPNAEGLVAGWGKTEEGGVNSPVVLSARLKYMNYTVCSRLLPAGVRPSLTIDKFCVEDIDGSRVQRGDSGGGLTFLNDDKYFLIGVVSTKVQDYALFTDVTNVLHRTWLDREKTKMTHSIGEL